MISFVPWNYFFQCIVDSEEGQNFGSANNLEYFELFGLSWNFVDFCELFDFLVLFRTFWTFQTNFDFSKLFLNFTDFSELFWTFLDIFQFYGLFCPISPE